MKLRNNIFFDPNSFEQSDGTARYESMEIKKLPDGTQINSVKGWYSYIDTNGDFYRVDYTGDENGFVVKEPEPIALPPRVIQTLLGRK